MVQRDLIFGTWFRTIDRGREDASAKPEGGNFVFRIEKKLAEYFNVTTYEVGTVIQSNPTKLTAAVLSEVRDSKALKTYQLDPKVVPTGPERPVGKHKRLSKGAKPKGRKATRQVTLILPEIYETKRWNKTTQEEEAFKDYRRKSCVFPLFFDNSMVLQFLGCIIKKNFPLEIVLGGGASHPFRIAEEGKIQGFDSGAWPITNTEAAKGVEGASLAAAVPIPERRAPSAIEQDI
ncbi:hypothetical protein [Roseofilum sp. Belize Diploria]|uniref:hypothetical protein n=1 Tax=Roseofilum sp. Belize Diploria TaxID=2821501 RepID=UPI001B20F2ED|nr:hypothetical protein [Roseofilum sp. Belize Diploria]MBP0008825.1 hypothetical protein [Roseofilum sp. Belize Diploria]